MFVVQLPFVPKSILRGNSVAQSWRPKAQAKKEMRESGEAHGLEIVAKHPDVDFPLKTDLHIAISYWNVRRVDCDNMLIGYKALLDGMQGIVYADDRQIQMMSISRHKGDPATMIVIREIEPEEDDNG